MKCALCSATNKALHRVNEKGVPGMFVCRPCINLSDFPRPDPALERLVNAIAKAR